MGGSAWAVMPFKGCFYSPLAIYLVVAGQLVEMQWGIFEVVWVIAFVFAGNLIWFSIMLFFGGKSEAACCLRQPISFGNGG